MESITMFYYNLISFIILVLHYTIRCYTRCYTITYQNTSYYTLLNNTKLSNTMLYSIINQPTSLKYSYITIFAKEYQYIFLYKTARFL